MNSVEFMCLWIAFAFILVGLCGSVDLLFISQIQWSLWICLPRVALEEFDPVENCVDLSRGFFVLPEAEFSRQ